MNTPDQHPEDPAQPDSAQDPHADAVEAIANEVAADQDVDQQLRKRIEELQGDLLRGQAELDNYRKRVNRELEQQQKYAAIPLLTDLVGVVDNLFRALEAAEAVDAKNDLTVGVRMVADAMKQVMSKHGCQQVGKPGDTFDPNIHEAIAQQPSDDHEPGRISYVHQQGYQLHDRVVRPAQVIVSSGPAPKQTEAN